MVVAVVPVRIGEDVGEKLDYAPGVFTVERHIRGKWACTRCRTPTQAPVPAEIIDKGIPTSGLLAQVLVAKYADHLPLYRQEQIFARAGLALPRSTLSASVCGVRLVCDDFAGYKAGFALGMTEVGCMAHARRKFVELHLTNKSTIAGTAIDFIGQLYGIEREVKAMEPAQRLHERRTRAVPIAKALHEWLLAQRTRITPGTATARAIDCSLKRWVALTRYLEDPALPIDNNFDEQQIRPWATGRKNWLFAGTLMAGQRAAAIMSLIQSAKLNGHDPYAYIRDVLTRLPTHPVRDIDVLLPHRWAPLS